VSIFFFSYSFYILFFHILLLKSHGLAGGPLQARPGGSTASITASRRADLAKARSIHVRSIRFN
jgi:hypothetical protein